MQYGPGTEKVSPSSNFAFVLTFLLRVIPKSAPCADCPEESASSVRIVLVYGFRLRLFSAFRISPQLRLPFLRQIILYPRTTTTKRAIFIAVVS
jgi:hypothetical protein